MHVSRLLSFASVATVAIFLVSCDKKRSPNWELTDIAKTSITTGLADVPDPEAPLAPQIYQIDPDSKPTNRDQLPSTPKTDNSKDELRFIAYNVENWLTMDRFTGKKMVKGVPKPEAEKNAVVKILVSNTPDVIGICEIGEAADLAEIQELLKAQGLDLPHSHFTSGFDPVRRLGLLSRYPIVATAKAAEMKYRMQGRTFGINRGILDATVSTNGKIYRFLGVHLKSKREVQEGDQEQMRINEAHLLRKHVNSIFRTDPKVRLIVYGDLNDSYPSKAVRIVTGSTDVDKRLMSIYFKDRNAEAWTYHWKDQDIYSRIDFVTISDALRNEINFSKCRIIDDHGWDSASDHRALLAVFK